jgi:hypothetical protein
MCLTVRRPVPARSRILRETPDEREEAVSHFLLLVRLIEIVLDHSLTKTSLRLVGVGSIK